MKTILGISAVLFAMALLMSSAHSAAVVKIDEDSQVKIGFRVQSLVIFTEKDLDGDGKFESETDFKVRRGRLRLGADITDLVSAFLQTDVGSGVGGSGFDWRLIDAWVALKPDKMFNIYAGENMVPASRQNVTSSGTLMAIDRPGINYKTLTWGTRSVTAFANNTFSDADAGLRGEVDVRDLGVTLFGSTSLSDQTHFKYYAGVYDGIQNTTEDEQRFAARVQLNLYDPEPNYYNAATYLGGKQTVGFGLSYDTQKDVASSADKGNVDYKFYTVDVFAEFPAGSGHLTLEGAYENLDLDGATLLDHDGNPLTAVRDATQSQGDGYYIQAGYYINQWQPWIEYESWDSDAASGKGGFDMYRIGLSYFIKGHNANIKAGYERLNADQNIGSTTEDKIDSIVVGMYVTY